MSIRHPKKMELLSKVEALKRSGVLLPSDLLEKVDSINEKWELLGVFAFLLLFVGSMSFFCVLKYALCLIFIWTLSFNSLDTFQTYYCRKKIVFFLSVFLFSVCVWSNFNNFSTLMQKKSK